jgi:hypothetical protein
LPSFSKDQTVSSFLIFLCNSPSIIGGCPLIPTFNFLDSILISSCFEVISYGRSMYTVNSSNVCYHQYPGPTPPFPARGFYLSLFSSFFSSSSPSFFSSTTLSSPFSYLPSLSSYYAYAFFFASSSIIFRASSSVTSSTTADDSPCFFLAASSYSFYYFFFFSSSYFFLMAYSLYLSS